MENIDGGQRCHILYMWRCRKNSAVSLLLRSRGGEQPWIISNKSP